jgi:beta-lactam-binding protein with PASTA domain
MAAVGLAAVAALSLVACNPSTTGASKAPATTGTAPETTGTTPAKSVPALVGSGLQAAQDAAQAAGFYNLKSHDSLGRDRHQILDRDWKVCSQTPAAGKQASTDTTLDFGAVKTTEACPTSDQAPPGKVEKTMPNYIGKGLQAATQSLPSSTSIDTTDAVGRRVIVLQSHWKICTQQPKAGTPFTGQPVKFTAVKTDETCP